MVKSGAWVVAVDGPAGSGKSSICAEVCRELDWVYVNTGLLYRAIGYVIMARGIDANDQQALALFLEEFIAEFSWDLQAKKIYWQGSDLSPELSSVAVGNQASAIAKIGFLRERLLPLQRELAFKAVNGILLDGRDISTVVFPDAHLKIFMTASLAVRAERRLLQLQREKPREQHPSLAALIANMEARDKQDSQRGAAPLAKAADAVELDTSSLSFVQAVAALKKLIESRVLKN